MAKRSEKEKARSRVLAVQERVVLMQQLAAGIAFFGADLLARLPHGFESLAKGKGQKVTKNKRVLILIAAVAYCMFFATDWKTKLYSIPLMALLALAVTQHKATYEGAAGAAYIVEAY